MQHLERFFLIQTMKKTPYSSLQADIRCFLLIGFTLWNRLAMQGNRTILGTSGVYEPAV